MAIVRPCQRRVAFSGGDNAGVARLVGRDDPRNVRRLAMAPVGVVRGDDSELLGRARGKLLVRRKLALW